MIRAIAVAGVDFTIVRCKYKLTNLHGFRGDSGWPQQSVSNLSYM